MNGGVCPPPLSLGCQCSKAKGTTQVSLHCALKAPLRFLQLLRADISVPWGNEPSWFEQILCTYASCIHFKALSVIIPATWHTLLMFYSHNPRWCSKKSETVFKTLNNFWFPSEDALSQCVSRNPGASLCILQDRGEMWTGQLWGSLKGRKLTPLISHFNISIAVPVRTTWKEARLQSLLYNVGNRGPRRLNNLSSTHRSQEGRKPGRHGRFAWCQNTNSSQF